MRRLSSIFVMILLLTSCAGSNENSDALQSGFQGQLQEDKTISISLNFDAESIFYQEAEILVQVRPESINPDQSCSSDQDNCGTSQPNLYEIKFLREDFAENKELTFVAPKGTSSPLIVNVSGLSLDNCNTASNSSQLNPTAQTRVAINGDFMVTEMACIVE